MQTQLSERHECAVQVDLLQSDAARRIYVFDYSSQTLPFLDENNNLSTSLGLGFNPVHDIPLHEVVCSFLSPVNEPESAAVGLQPL